MYTYKTENSRLCIGLQLQAQNSRNYL